ncbi:MAG TPA: signal peptide peptidase SppA [Verrucomicrobiae bacterium]|jgi:protease-4
MDSNVPPTPSPPPGPPAPTLPPLLARSAPPPPPRKSRGWMIVSFVLLLLLALSLFSNVSSLFSGFLSSGPATAEGPRLEEVSVESHDSDNKIAIIPVSGLISGQSFDGSGLSLPVLIKHQLKRAARDKSVKAVLLKVDSPGGEVLASDEINRELAEFQAKHNKPVIAVMGSVAASGGYYVSAPCRWIVANELTITGSIGVIIHSFNYRGLMDKVGLRPEVYKSGKFKDMLSGDKKESEVTPEERQMVQALVDTTFEKFKRVVADGRKHANDQNSGAGRKLSKDWVDYADGRVLSGKEAYDLGFVDELGAFDTAVDRAKAIAGIKSANLVRYDPVFDLSSLLLRMFSKTDVHSVKVDLGLDLPRLQAGYLYFLAPTVLH